MRGPTVEPFTTNCMDGANVEVEATHNWDCDSSSVPANVLTNCCFLTKRPLNVDPVAKTAFP